MRPPTRPPLPLLLLYVQACLPDPSGLGSGFDGTARVAVVDARGTTWPNDAMPRSPRLRLWHDARLESRKAPARAWLLRGAATPEDLADLETDRPREQTRTRIVATSTEVGAQYIELRPAAPLASDTAYTLAWAEGVGPQSAPLRTSALPQAGAALIALWPAPLAVAVPTNLRALRIYFDGAVETSAATVQLRSEADDQTLALPMVACDPALSSAVGCLAAELPTSLAPHSTYQARLQGSFLDSCGASLTLPAYSFTTGRGPDTSSPVLAPIACDLDEDPVGDLCMRRIERSLLLRARSNEPVVASFQGCGAGPVRVEPAAELLLEVEAIAEGACGAVLRLENAAGLQTDLPLAIPAAEALASLSIDEVRADPLGAEPDQEYVEIFNFGPVALSLLGFTLSKEPEGRGVTFEPTFTIEPMERVLAVAPDFSRHAEPTARGADVEPPAGVRLVRLSSALGLSASGTALVLRDANGKRVSAAPASSAGREGACIARRALDPRSGAPARFEADPQLRCTPGAPTAFP
jgi:hypothetical protein